MKLNFLFLSAMLTAIVLMATTAQANERRERAEEVVNTLSAGAGQPALENMRRHFPFLADATLDYALGDIWGRNILDHRTRQLATVAAFAATGDIPYMTTHARYALNLGVSPDELREIVYLTTVHAGFPSAINAASALSELFDEHQIETSGIDRTD